ncbi:hypothetical protein R5M54_003503 [Vibrio alginolyticus]|nr:hypothetical protein [Vibrio alginolyticus]ELA9460351.1 hypothetical protein [Vibrio alginolyticus]ELS4797110.1 hypothetical protein [Vibrio alginolyticus]
MSQKHYLVVGLFAETGAPSKKTAARLLLSNDIELVAMFHQPLELT